MNTRVHTVIVRACSLTREQVFAIHANTSPKSPRRIQHYIKRGVGASEGVCTIGGGPCVAGQKKGPLPWHEENKLGFRAALLRDWLLNAARQASVGDLFGRAKLENVGSLLRRLFSGRNETQRKNGTEFSMNSIFLKCAVNCGEKLGKFFV